MARLIILFFRRLLPVVTFNVRGVAIKAVVPVHQLGGFQRLTHWEEQEPYCLDWIDSFSPNDVLIDIGCAEGTESLYAALKHKGLKKIYAFDVGLLGGFNFTANIKLNKIDNVEFYLVGMSDAPGFIEVGEARGYYKVGAYPELGETSKNVATTSVDAFCAHRDVVPNHIKIDVDGIETKIVEGMSNTLERPEVKSVFVEINDDDDRTRISDMLHAKGFVTQARHDDNHIFVRE